MEIYNKKNQGAHIQKNLKEPIVSVSRNGTWRFNRAAMNQLSITNGDKVSVINNGEWYVSFIDEAEALELREYGKQKTIQFTHKMAAVGLIKAIASDAAKTVFMTFDLEPCTLNGLLAYMLLKSKIPPKM
jgi:hypothetical protein